MAQALGELGEVAFEVGEIQHRTNVGEHNATSGIGGLDQGEGPPGGDITLRQQLWSLEP
jgi:hypothetical protein